MLKELKLDTQVIDVIRNYLQVHSGLRTIGLQESNPILNYYSFYFTNDKILLILLLLMMILFFTHKSTGIKANYALPT